MEEKKKTSEAQMRATAKWRKAHYSRASVDFPKEYHEYLKEYVAAQGKTLGAFIKEAIAEKIERETSRK